MKLKRKKEATESYSEALPAISIKQRGNISPNLSYFDGILNDSKNSIDDVSSDLESSNETMEFEGERESEDLPEPVSVKNHKSKQNESAINGLKDWKSDISTLILR